MGWGAGLVTAPSAQFQASWSCHFPQCIRHKERCWKHGLKTKCCREMLSLLHTTYIKTVVTHPHKGHKNSPLIKQKPNQIQEKMKCIQCKSAIGACDMDGPEPNHHCHVPCKHYQYWWRSHNCPWKPCHNCHCTTLYLAVSFQINTYSFCTD